MLASLHVRITASCPELWIEGAGGSRGSPGSPRNDVALGFVRAAEPTVTCFSLVLPQWPPCLWLSTAASCPLPGRGQTVPGAFRLWAEVLIFRVAAAIGPESFLILRKTVLVCIKHWGLDAF